MSEKLIGTTLTWCIQDMIEGKVLMIEIEKIILLSNTDLSSDEWLDTARSIIRVTGCNPVDVLVALAHLIRANKIEIVPFKKYFPLPLENWVTHLE